MFEISKIREQILKIAIRLEGVELENLLLRKKLMALICECDRHPEEVQVVEYNPNTHDFSCPYRQLFRDIHNAIAEGKARE